jgi:uncharacterized protein (TIGR02145 family)
LENGQIVSGAEAPTYVVPSGKAAGQYTYIRQAKSVDCSEWQSSNEFVVTVFNCSFSAGTETGATAIFVDPRDGKRYKTVVMPDGKTWFAQNLNYTKDLTYNAYAYEANGVPFTSMANGVPAIGSYWCPPKSESVVSGDEAACNVYGALYTWETAMMVDGKYADETKTNSAWDESWVSSNTFTTGVPGSTKNADKNNARGGTNMKDGGRGICPMGWHIPTDREWAQLLDAVEGNTTFTESQNEYIMQGVIAGKNLKSATTHTDPNSAQAPSDGSWYAHPNRGDDIYGFTVLPTGARAREANRLFLRGYEADLWSSSVGSSMLAWHQIFRHSALGVMRYLNHRAYGFAVRCLSD